MTEETYEAKRIEFDNAFFMQFRPNMFVGVRYRFENLFALKPIPGGLLDEGAITGAEGGISSGIGLSLRLDNRDNILNPQLGEYLATSPLYFSNLTGSNFSFTLLEVDLRKYCKAPLKSIVALQTFTQLAFGSPPFRMMALLGGENVMRGYYTGRYRDNHLLAAQAEWRLPVYWIFGATVFLGAGDVFHYVSDLSVSNIKPSYGLGLRIRVDKENNVNLRFDYALGKSSSGFYVAFGEAF